VKLTTKFNIGDRLWHVYELGGKTHVGQPFDCLIVTRNEHETTYSFTKLYSFPESNLFASKEEAQQECASRNGAKERTTP
jgi:hypothetical protein